MSETKLLDPQEQCEVIVRIGDAITSLSKALAIITRAKERIVDGSVNVTIEYSLKDAIRNANNAAIQATE